MDHHTVETCTVSDESVISGIFGRNGRRGAPTKKNRIIQTVTSNKSKSQGLSWYGVVSVPLAKVTCTSVMAPLMLKSTRDFGAQYAAFKKTSFPGTSMHISTRQCKNHICTHYKVLAAEEEGTGT